MNISMSHEIRTPLNGVLGLATLLAESSLTVTQRENVESIQFSGEHLLTVSDFDSELLPIVIKC